MPELFLLAGRAWIPVASETGRHGFVRLRDITSPLDGEPIARLATGRPDCDTSLAEFLIGLLAVALGPDLDSAWSRLYDHPPGPETLDEAFAPFADALVLDGDGPRFFQDHDELVDKPTPVESLFIDAPADHFMVDNRFQALSRTGAAIALLTLQTMAPSGGAGHRTSLRGGGPLSTFAVPRGRATLWQRLWANVPLNWKAEPADIAQVMPWLAATRTSNPKEGGVSTTPSDVAEAQAFFAMPRRIRLNFEPNTESIPCDLTGIVDDVIVRTYVTRPWGADYLSSAWRHPLSPYYKPKQSATETLPVHLKSSRIGYQDWLGLVSSAGETEFPARAIKDFRDKRARLIAGENRDLIRLLACGYALDNMKPLDFGEALLPLFATGSEDGNLRLDATARGMILAAEEARSQLVRAVRQALFGAKAKIDVGSTVLSGASDRFWADTEQSFYACLRTLCDRLSEATTQVDAPQADVIATQWLATLRKTALAIFDDTAPIQDSDPERLADVIEARKFLSLTFHGLTAAGAKIYAALGLPAPTRKAASSKKSRKAKT